MRKLILKKLVVLALVLTASSSGFAHTDGDFVFFYDRAVIGQILIMLSVILGTLAVTFERNMPVPAPIKQRDSNLDSAIVTRLGSSNV